MPEKNTPKLDSFSLLNFRSYRQAEIRFGRLTLLVGPNASGKSNLIEGLRLLCWLARGLRFSELPRQIAGGEVCLRGDSNSFAYETSGKGHFRLGCQVSPKSLDFQADLLTAPLGLLHERLTSLNDVYYSAFAESSKSGVDPCDVEYNSFAKGRNPKIHCNSQQLVLTQLTTPAPFRHQDRESKKRIPEAANAVREVLRRTFFFDAEPRHMRGYVRKDSGSLHENGQNTSAVLWELCQKPSAKDELLQFVKSLPDGEITDIGFLGTDKGDEYKIKLTERFGDRTRECDADLLSDGTLRVLAVAAALLSAEPGSLVVIEEIDSGVHPSRAKRLLSNIHETASRRNLRVLLTTHNPALMDAVPDEAIGDVACCYRDPDEGHSRIMHIKDLHEAPEVLAQGPLGQVVTQGILDRYLKDKRTPEQKKQQKLQWLQSLRETGS